MKVSADAGEMMYYRNHPDVWVEKFMKIKLAHYRSRAKLENFLEKAPANHHQWARKMLAQGKLKLDHTKSYQAEALRTMAKPGFYAFKWANGLAKTTTASLLVHWFLHNYPGSTRVVTTAGTWSQLREQLWREIGLWSERVQKPIAASIKRMAKTHIDLGSDWIAFGRAANEESTFEGVHADYVMILMDEAKAIKPGIFNAARRILRGNPNGKFWWVALSSPGSPTGPFYELCQNPRWHVFSMSAYESDRVLLDTIADDISDIGEESPLFWAMDLGEFPEEAEDTLIPLSWVQAAQSRRGTDGVVTGGVDIARFGGDESVIAMMNGSRLSLIEAYSKKDLMETAGKVARFSRMVSRVGIDDAGLGGGVTDRLVEIKRNQPEQVGTIVPLNNAMKPTDDRNFFNLGAEMGWNLRQRFKVTYDHSGETVPPNGIVVPDDKKLISQLTGRKYNYSSDGRIRMESKEDMRRRGEKSPDRAEAAMMAAWMQRSNFAKDSELFAANAAMRDRSGMGATVNSMEF